MATGGGVGTASVSGVHCLAGAGWLLGTSAGVGHRCRPRLFHL